MVISVADAYRIDPATGQVDMDLFQQFADQQAIANQTVNPNSPTFDNSLALSAGQNYLAANPDVLANAQQRAQAEGLSSGDAYSNRLNEIAQEHYNAFGQNEGRAGFGNPAGPPLSSVGGGNQTMPPPANMMPPNNQGGYDFSGVNSQFQSALGNFGGLLDSFGSLTGGLLSGLQNNQTANAAYNPYQGYPNANYAAPNFQGYGGSNNMSSGWNAGSNWGGGSAGGAANTGHNMLWTV